jgi:hypothetical protein
MLWSDSGQYSVLWEDERHNGQSPEDTQTVNKSLKSIHHQTKLKAQCVPIFPTTMAKMKPPSTDNNVQ